MADYISLTCPTCGTKLKITDDMNNFACGHCGSEHIVKREGGAISLAPLVESEKGTSDSVDKTESELAIPRLEKEINQLESVISEMRTKLKTEDCLQIATGVSSYTILVGTVVSATGGKLWSFITTMGVGLGTFFAALVVLFVVTERKEAKPKKEIEKRKQEIEKHRKILSL